MKPYLDLKHLSHLTTFLSLREEESCTRGDEDLFGVETLKPP